MLAPNRVAAIGSFCVSVSALVVAFAGVFPKSWQNFALAAAGLISHVPVIVTYLIGAQKSEALQAHQATPLPPSGWNPPNALTPER